LTEYSITIYIEERELALYISVPPPTVTIH